MSGRSAVQASRDSDLCRQRSKRVQADQQPQLLFEACERRLVLSAQLLLDVLGDQPLEMHSGPLAQSQPAQAVLAADNSASQLEMHLREAHAATGLNAAREQFGLTGRGQTVAVIDSGIAWDHVSLGGGYGPGYRVTGGWDFTEENDASPYDDGPFGFHGTHVAGIIGSDHAIHHGVAPEVDLVALRVFNDAGQGKLEWVERALDWVHANQDSFENPITTVNLSLGTTWNADSIPEWASLEEELKALHDDGILVTASAGNSFAQYQEAGLSYPAASSYVLPVASVDDDGRLSDFSQRSERVLAAPGRNILSTVPDHVYGVDGDVSDFSSASGTSMAAPYVAGATALVRQAMQMVGVDDINTDTIASHLRSTASSVYDSATGAFYDRLDLHAAIDAIIPDDTVGDSVQQATSISLHNPLSGFVNTVHDIDVFQFTADASGSLALDVESSWSDSLAWELLSSDHTVAQGGAGESSLNVVAGQTYELAVFTTQSIGSYTIDFNLDASSGSGSIGEPGGAAGEATGPDVTAIEPGRFYQQSHNAGSQFTFQAAADGLLTVHWTNPENALGAMQVHTPDGTVENSAWDSGSLRIDLPVTAGQTVGLTLPGAMTDTGDLTIANLLSQTGRSVAVVGTMSSDSMQLDLSNQIELQVGNIAYEFSRDQIDTLQLDGNGSNDSLQVIGSAAADKVDLRAGGSTIVTAGLSIQIDEVEEIDYSGGGGADRVYIYDTDGDDVLTALPRSAELTGVGYRFSVEDIDRIFMHATGGGQDFAYLYDSAGDDRLSVRPQFSSISGDGFFNYVRGFERVYAYANAGGQDSAKLYDSAGDDRFSTSGASASIVGTGFSSFTRNFEQVTGYSQAGGADRATLYGSTHTSQWQVGSDFVEFADGQLSRTARGFSNVETFRDGQAFTPQGIAAIAAASAVPGTPTPESTLAAGLAASQHAAEQIPALESGAFCERTAGAWQRDSLAEAALSSQSHWIMGTGSSGIGSSGIGFARADDAPGTGVEPLRPGINTQHATPVQHEASAVNDWITSAAPPPPSADIHPHDEQIFGDPELEALLLDDIFRQLGE